MTSFLKELRYIKLLNLTSILMFKYCELQVAYICKYSQGSVTGSLLCASALLTLTKFYTAFNYIHRLEN